MDDLSEEQISWIIAKFKKYFRYVNCPPTKSYIDFFRDYIRFDKDEVKMLPSHLQHWDKTRPLGIDIAELIKNEPFLSLIKGNRLVDIHKSEEEMFKILGKKIKERCFDILRYLIIKDNMEFSCKFAGTYEKSKPVELISRLFLNKIKEKGMWIEFDVKQNNNKPIKSFDWDSSELIVHEGNFIKAFKYFARGIYSRYSCEVGGLYNEGFIINEI